MSETSQSIHQPHSSKLVPAGLILVTLLTVLSPVVENFKRKPVDSFPLSYYPMFSAKRGDHYSGQALIGIDHEGNRHHLRHTFAGSGGFNQVRRQIAAAVKEGRAQETCETVAKRVARSKRYNGPKLNSVQVVTATHNLNAFFAGDAKPVAETLHAACPVPAPSKDARPPKSPKVQ
jgi:hypothetical protein